MTGRGRDWRQRDAGAARQGAFPLHHHCANEEHFFILSRTGVLRGGAETFAVKPQDYIVNLPGGGETAHQLVNTGTESLVYLAISTAVLPECWTIRTP